MTQTIYLPNDFVEEVNEAIENDTYIKYLDQKVIRTTFSDGFSIDLEIITENDEPTTYLNPVLFNQNGCEVDYIDCADCGELDGEFIFNHNDIEYTLIIRKEGK